MFHKIGPPNLISKSPYPTTSSYILNIYCFQSINLPAPQNWIYECNSFDLHIPLIACKPSQYHFIASMVPKQASPTPSFSDDICGQGHRYVALHGLQFPFASLATDGKCPSHLFKVGRVGWLQPPLCRARPLSYHLFDKQNMRMATTCQYVRTSVGSLNPRARASLTPKL